MRRKNIKFEKFKPKRFFWMDEPSSDSTTNEIFFKMMMVISKRNRININEEESGFEPLF